MLTPALRRALPLPAALLLFCGGCHKAHTPPGPNLKVPSRFTASRTIAPRAATGWIAEIGDRKLTSLIDEAMRYNNDLAVSAARLRSARANVQLAGAALLPQISTEGSGSRRKSVVEGPDGMGGTRTVNNYASTYNIGANLNWEVDLWGRLLNRKRAAVADMQAAAADHHAFKLSLAANVARSWFSAAEAELQVQLGRDTVKSLESNLRFVERGVDLGTSDVLDLRLTRANLEGSRGNLEARLRQWDEAKRSLEVLLGRYPSNQIKVTGDLPGLRRNVPAGLPSELLLRRPNLVASERRLAAASERIVESKKDFLPSFSLTGSTGTSSEQLGRLLNPKYLAWAIAGNAAQPLFQGGRLAGNLERAKAQYDEAVASFQQNALQAFREVETALSAETFLSRQVLAQEKAVVESLAAEELAWEQYSNGLVDGLTWLEAQRRSFNAGSSLLQLKNLRLQNRIDLHLALGGDFRTKPNRQETPTVNAN